MELFLMALCISVFGLAVAALSFGAATRDDWQESETRVAKPAHSMATARFLDPAALPAVGSDVKIPTAGVPIEVLLLQIERHVRLEQAAAESFLLSPTSASLHSRTDSPLVH